MRRLFFTCFILLTAAFPLLAQRGGWCGYALIEGLPVLENQLAVIAAITPSRHERSQPHELFQYRFSLDHTKVIIEGCFELEPRREVIVSLFEQVIDVPEVARELPVERSGELQTEQVREPLTREQYINEKLVYSLFAPGGTREESAASVRAYLQANIREWETELE